MPRVEIARSCPPRSAPTLALSLHTAPLATRAGARVRRCAPSTSARSACRFRVALLRRLLFSSSPAHPLSRFRADTSTSGSPRPIPPLAAFPPPPLFAPSLSLSLSNRLACGHRARQWPRFERGAGAGVACAAARGGRGGEDTVEPHRGSGPFGPKKALRARRARGQIQLRGKRRWQRSERADAPICASGGGPSALASRSAPPAAVRALGLPGGALSAAVRARRGASAAGGSPRRFRRAPGGRRRRRGRRRSSGRARGTC